MASGKGDVLTGETDVFSTYLIAYRDQEDAETEVIKIPKTGDNGNPALWLVLTLMGLAGALGFFARIRTGKKRE